MASDVVAHTEPPAVDPAPVRSLAAFTTAGYDKGRPVAVQAVWFAVMNLVFAKWWFPARLRPPVLRLFGAEVGPGVFIRHRVRVLWPWKLRVGANTWIGEDTWILNLEPVDVGSDVCLSQGVRLITGSHDRRSPTFAYDNGPISIGDGAWIAFEAAVLRGVTVGARSTVAARALVHRNVPEDGLVR